MIEFYCDDEVSMNMPGMKDYVSIRNDEGERRHVQKRLILSNLKELYVLFRSKYTETKIGFSTFVSLRPKNCVLAGMSGTHTVCVCAIHENVKLMMLGEYYKPFERYKTYFIGIVAPPNFWLVNVFQHQIDRKGRIL